MNKLTWVNDIHLDFADQPVIEGFREAIKQTGGDGVLIGGDIGEAPSLEKYLKYLARKLACPIYLVLGDHDYYHGSICGVRDRIMELSQKNPLLHWLPSRGVVELSDKTALIGYGSWADGRLGDYLNSEVMLNDYWLIEELRDLNKTQRLKQLNQLGDPGSG